MSCPFLPAAINLNNFRCLFWINGGREGHPEPFESSLALLFAIYAHGLGLQTSCRLIYNSHIWLEWQLYSLAYCKSLLMDFRSRIPNAENGKKLDKTKSNPTWKAIYNCTQDEKEKTKDINLTNKGVNPVSKMERRKNICRRLVTFIHDLILDFDFF